MAPTLLSPDINLNDAQQVAHEIGDTGRQSLATHLDVTVQQSVDAMVESTIERFGRIDILVSNAGVIGAQGWEERDETTLDDWDVTYEVNVKGMVRVIEAVTPHMKKRRHGKIVNIASIAGRQGTLTSVPYAASKAAVINLTRSLALKLAPFDINVNAICPGLLWTPMWMRIADHFTTTDESYEGLSPREAFDIGVKNTDTAGAGADARGHRQRDRVPGIGPGPEHHGAVHQRERRVASGLSAKPVRWLVRGPRVGRSEGHAGRAPTRRGPYGTSSHNKDSQPSRGTLPRRPVYHRPTIRGAGRRSLARSPDRLECSSGGV